MSKEKEEDKNDEPKDIKSALAALNKRYDIRISKIGDRDDGLTITTLPSGSFTVDRALGIGGYPRGRIIEIFGQQGSGKTLLSLLAIAEAQKLGGQALFIDVEHALDKNWAKKLGVDADNLYFVQPDYGEQALTILEEAVKTNEFDIIVLDSTAALIPKAELDADLEDQQMALQARMMSKAMRVLTGCVGKSKTVVIFINQTRTNLMVRYGDNTETPGGQALKFYSSVRIRVGKVSQSMVEEKGVVVGHSVKITVVKNKVGPPLREAEFALNYNTGVNRTDELATMAIADGIVEQRGPMTYYKERSWKGREAFLTDLKADAALQEAIKQELLPK